MYLQIKSFYILDNGIKATQIKKMTLQQNVNN